MSFGSRSLRKPTPDEQARMTAIKERNLCIVSGKVGVELHHLLSGNVRIGHRYTVGLHPSEHALVKRKWWKEAHPDQEILNAQDDAIDWPRATIPTRRQRRGSTDRPAKRVPRTYPQA